MGEGVSGQASDYRPNEKLSCLLTVESFLLFRTGGCFSKEQPYHLQNSTSAHDEAQDHCALVNQRAQHAIPIQNVDIGSLPFPSFAFLVMSTGLPLFFSSTLAYLPFALFCCGVCGIGERGTGYDGLSPAAVTAETVWLWVASLLIFRTPLLCPRVGLNSGARSHATGIAK